MEKKGPNRLVSGSAASVLSMANSMEMWTISTIWWRLAGVHLAQEMVPQKIPPFEAKDLSSQGDSISTTLGK